MGGRMEGCLNGGADGGAIFGIHGGAQEGRWIYIWSIFYLQKRDFLISMFVWAWKGGAPPWIHFRNIKIWYVTINQNKKSLIFDYYSCFYDFKHEHIRFLAIFGIRSSSQELEKFCRNTKNRWFLVFRSTLSLEAKTCDINVIFLMSIRYNFEFMKFVSYNMEGRMGGRSVSKLAQRNEITMIKFEIGFITETDQYIPWRPPIRPSMLYDTNFINSKLYLIDI